MQVFNFALNRLLIFILFAGLSACGRYSSFFFVKNAGAIMPVKISGNPESNTFLILLPGGPAGDGLVYRRVFPVFRKSLENRYRVVYYDQRGSGNCQGVYDTTTLNLAQLSEDLDRVVAVIRVKYPDSRIFLLGYSYGGALGLTYLLDPDQRARVQGFIGLAGAFDRQKQAEYQQLLVEYLLDRWVAEGYIKSFEALETGFNCDEQADPTICRQDSIALQGKINERFAQVEGANQFPVNAAAVGRLLGYVFFSQSNPLLSGTNESQNGKYFQPEFDSLLLSDRAGAVTTPTLLINGRWDTNVPFFDAQTLYERLGTPAGQKTLVILERSGHLLMLTEPGELAAAIFQFLENGQPGGNAR